jgi:hypothetical protein
MLHARAIQYDNCVTIINSSWLVTVQFKNCFYYFPPACKAEQGGTKTIMEVKHKSEESKRLETGGKSSLISCDWGQVRSQRSNAINYPLPLSFREKVEEKVLNKM